MNSKKYIKRVKIFLYIMSFLSLVFFGVAVLNEDLRQIIITSLTTLTLATMFLMLDEIK